MWKQVFADHARRTPDAAAVTTPERTVGYGRMAEDLERLSGRIAGLALPAGATVAVWVREPYLQWLTMLAVDRLGFPSFSFFNEPFDEAGWRIVRPARVFTDRAEMGADERFTLIDPAWLEQPAPAFAEPAPDPDAPARLQLSSGTTGTPKQVVWTRRIQEHRVRNILQRALPPNVRSLTMFLPQTGLGFVVPLATFIQGGTVLACEGLFWDAALWDLKPNYIAATPRHLREILTKLPAGFRPDPGLQIMTGGSATPRALQRAVSSQISPNLHVWYGASETGMVAHCFRSVLDRYETAAGELLPGAEAEIVDAEGKPAPTGEIGQIRLRTPVMVAGYKDNPEQTRASFRDGWFYPGDTGFLTEERVLVLEGRASEVMNFGGTKVSPEAAESAAMAAPGVLDAGAFTMPGGHGMPVLWVAVKTGPGFSEAAVQERVQAAVKIKPVMVAQLRQIPRNPAGKIQRELLAGLVRARGGWKKAAPGRRR